MVDKDIRIAIVPGSFDPITKGHINIVERATKLYDKVYLAVMINSEKDYMFTLEERERIARAAVEDFERVEVISSSGYLWMLARDLGACAIVKGVRNEIDREYELKMAEYNLEHYPDAETILLPTEESLAQISSTAVRQRICDKEALSEYLPDGVISEISAIFAEREGKSE